MTEEKKAALAGETAADEQKLQKERKTIDALTDFSNMYDFKRIPITNTRRKPG